MTIQEIKVKYPKLKDVLKALMRGELTGYTIYVPSCSDYAIYIVPLNHRETIENLDDEYKDKEKYWENEVIEFPIDAKRPASDAEFIFDFLEAMDIKYITY